MVDLFFEDCTTPPVDVATKFLDIAEGIQGRIAVHCNAGLGRTGTLIALYLMKHYGFKVREAMAWLLIVWAGEATAVSLRQREHHAQSGGGLLPGRSVPPREAIVARCGKCLDLHQQGLQAEGPSLCCNASSVARCG